jgi:hypothetical protein
MDVTLDPPVEFFSRAEADDAQMFEDYTNDVRKMMPGKSILSPQLQAPTDAVVAYAGKIPLKAMVDRINHGGPKPTTLAPDKTE